MRAKSASFATLSAGGATPHASGSMSDCEGSDPSQTQPHLRRARLTDEGGRGLFLVARLTHRWRSRYTVAGKPIWSEQLLEEVP